MRRFPLACLAVLTIVFSWLTLAPAGPGPVDLDVTYIERTPRYPSLHGKVDYPEGIPVLTAAGASIRKFAPDVGEVVTFAAHVVNKGTQPSGAFTYKFLWDKSVLAEGSDAQGLAPGQEGQYSFVTKWPEGRHSIGFQVTLGDGRADSCPANDLLEDATDALGFRIHVYRETYDGFNANPNIIGSYSFEDWLQWHVRDMNQKFADAVYPSTPQGCQERIRIDRIAVVNDEQEEKAEVEAHREGFQGAWGFAPWNDYPQRAANPDWGLIHEWAHQLGLIDLYLFNFDPAENRIPGPDGMPLCIGYSFPNPKTMMHWHGPHPFSEMDAWALNQQLGRSRGYYGDYLYAMCDRYYFRVLDITGEPVPGARVLIYQGGRGREAFPEPVGGATCDQDGVCLIPNRPAPHITTFMGFTQHDNPFGQINIVGANGLLFFRIAARGQEMHRWMNITEFNVPYYRGARESYTFELRTLLPPLDAAAPPKQVRAIRTAPNKVGLTWEPSSDSSVTAYKVYAKNPRVDDEPGNFKTVATITAEASPAAPDLTLEAGENAFYVTSVRADGTEGGPSPPVYAPLVVTPYDLAVDAAGDVFLTDAHPHTGAIYAMDPTGRWVDFVYQPDPGRAGRLMGIVADASGRLICANSYQHQITIFDNKGNFLKAFGEQGSGLGQLAEPTGIDLTPEGNIVVTDRTNNCVLVFDEEGKFLGSVGTQGAGAGQFQNPSAVAVDGRGRIIVADTGNNRVQVLDADGTYLGNLPGEFRNPTGVAADALGNIYVCDAGQRRLAVFDGSGKFLGEFRGTQDNPLARPTNCTVDRRGNLLIIDGERAGVVTVVPLRELLKPH